MLTFSYASYFRLDQYYSKPIRINPSIVIVNLKDSWHLQVNISH